MSPTNPDSGHTEENSFLQTLSYPKDQEYPFPAHDTGKKVTAIPYTDDPWDESDEDKEPEQIQGILLIRPSPFGGLQCFVKTDGSDEEQSVDPNTVAPVEEDND